MSLLWASSAGPRKQVRRLLAGVALSCAGAAFGSVGLGFATWALFVTIRAQYGVADAAAAIAAIYLVLAVALLAWRGKIAPVAAAETRSLGNRQSVKDTTDRLARLIAAGSATRPLALGEELAEQLTPVQLVLLAALTGFVAGRKA